MNKVRNITFDKTYLWASISKSCFNRLEHDMSRIYMSKRDYNDMITFQIEIELEKCTK